MKNLYPTPFGKNPFPIKYAWALLLALPGSLAAQLPITAVYTHKANAISSLAYTGTGATGNASSGMTANNYTYNFGKLVATTNNLTILDSIRANSLTYHYQPAVYSVKFRRVNNTSVTGLRKSMRIEQTGGNVSANGTVSLLPDYNDSLEQVFVQRAINIGIDNLFQNATTTNNMNIERMDVLYPFGIKLADNTRAGFAVFDWGNSGGHDPIIIAAIKTLDPSGNPSAYFRPVPVTAGNYGGNVLGDATYVIMRKNETDSRLLLMNNSTTQNRDGAFLRLSDLGVPNNTISYGYSIFGPDVDSTPVSNLVNYTTAANFPTNSDLSGGGFDPLAVTGLWVLNSTLVALPEQATQLHPTVLSGKVTLQWNLLADGTAAQIIERSPDGTNFTAILQLPVAATGPQTATDESPLKGMNYYRLKLVNADGSYTVSAMAAVTLKEAGLWLQVSPNPARDKKIHVTLQLPDDQAGTLSVVDLQGSTIYQQQVASNGVIQTTIPLGGQVNRGIYLLTVTDKKGKQLIQRRIMVE